MILQARILEWALFPPLDDLPDAGTEPASPEAPASAGEFFTTRATWETLVCAVASVVTDSLQPYGLSPARLLCPWDSPGKDTGVGCLALLQGIFPTQGSNLGLMHGRWILHQLSHQGSPNFCIVFLTKRD